MRWIEAVTACRYFSVMMTYYIEGQKGHIMEEHLMKQSRTYATRGKLFSFALQWDDIMAYMNERTTEEQMRAWPHAPKVVSQWVRVVLKKGDIDMMKHIKELKIRAHVVQGLARLYIDRHIAALGDKLGGLQLRDRMQRLHAKVDDRMREHYPADV